MKVLIGGLILLGLSACVSKPIPTDDYYERANSASEKAQRNLD